MVITTTASKITQRARKKRGFSCKNLQKCNAVEEVDTKNRTNVVFFLKKTTPDHESLRFGVQVVPSARENALILVFLNTKSQK